jgi:soluble cytochrome b562
VCSSDLLPMKIRVLLATLTCALVVATGVRAQAPASKRQFETPLGDQMAKMSDALKTLKAQISDASKNADSLKQVATIRSAANASLKLEPAKKADIPAADQAKFVAGFQDGLKNLIAQVGKVEAALKANDNAAAAKAIEEVDAAQKAGHKDYKQKKQKKA